MPGIVDCLQTRSSKLVTLSQSLLHAVKNNQSLSIYLTRHFSRDPGSVLRVAIDRQALVRKLKFSPACEEPQIKFVLLTARLPHPPALHMVKRRSPPKGAARLWQLPLRQEHPRISRLRNYFICANEFTIVQPFPSGWATDYVGVEMLSRNLELPFQLGASEVVVRVEVLNPITPSKLKESVTSNISSLIWTTFPANPTVKASNDRETVIRRSVIDDDDLLVGPRLSQSALDSARYPAFGVVTGNEYRNERAHGMPRILAWHYNCDCRSCGVDAAAAIWIKRPRNYHAS